MNENIRTINNSEVKINLKQDFIFKKIFSENEKLLISLLEAILKVKITKIDVDKDFSLSKYYSVGRGGILDIKAEIDGTTNINIEMQVKNKHNITDRLLYYGTSVKNETLKQGQDFSEIKPIISIGILDYINYKDEEATNFISESEFTIYQHNLEGKKIQLEKLDQKQRIILIELPKFYRLKHNLSDKLQQWLSVMQWEKFEEIEDAMRSNKEIEEAVKQLTLLSSDKEVKAIYDYEMSAKLERNTEDRILKEEATAEGLAKGHAKGLKEGRKEGREEGRKVGIQEGEYKKQKEIVIRLADSGMQIEDIAKIVQMEIQEIEKIIKDK